MPSSTDCGIIGRTDEPRASLHQMAYKPKKRPNCKPPAGAIPKAPPSGVYLPDNERLVRMIAAKGATDSEMEEMFALSAGTIEAWRERYPGMAKALDEGRANPDQEVLFSLFKNATGYEFKEEQAVGGRTPCVLSVKRHARGSFDAQKYWLRMRRPETYNIPDRGELSGAGGGPIGVKDESRAELIEAIVSLVQPQPDPEPPKPKQDRRR